LRTCPRLRVTEKSHLFHTNCRSGWDRGSTRATCVAGSVARHSAIHYDFMMLFN
jgi:hypothetical protein